MIRVTIEIIPFSGEPAKKLGFVDIGNVSGLAEIASYEYEARIDGRIVRGRLDHHLRQHGAVRLAARILGQVVADLERSDMRSDSPESPAHRVADLEGKLNACREDLCREQGRVADLQDALAACARAGCPAAAERHPPSVCPPRSEVTAQPSPDRRHAESNGTDATAGPISGGTP